MNVAMLGFLHESNTFLAAKTGYEDFARVSLTRGDAMIERWRSARHELGGMIAGCAETGLKIAGGMAGLAMPSGTITAESYEQLASELLAALKEALPVDGILMALHGATVSEQFPDADGELLRRVRQLVGPELPIIVTLDLHANISPAMARHSSALIVYRTNPHLDQFERGHEAALLIAKIFRHDANPVQALEAPPLVLPISCQYTKVDPARQLYADLDEVRAWPGILSASVAMGFYFADVEEMGASFVAVSDSDAALAHRAAMWMATRAWERRQSFLAHLPDAATAVRQAMQSGNKPVVLMDIGDNIGGGSPADSTILFSEVMRQGGRNAMVILCDAEAVRACAASGVGSRIALRVGAKSDDRHGAPVAIQGRVRSLSDGIFVERQVRHGGWGGGNQGLTAVVETDEQHTVVLTSLRMAPMSLEQVISLGIHPEQKDILIVKGVVAPRAAYEPIAGELILVDTPGVTSNNPANFNYRHRRHPLYPLEMDAEFPQHS